MSVSNQIKSVKSCHCKKITYNVEYYGIMFIIFMHKKTNYWLVKNQLMKHQLCYSCESTCRSGKALCTVQSTQDDHDFPHVVAFACSILAIMGGIGPTITLILLGFLTTILASIVDKNPSKIKVIVGSILPITARILHAKVTACGKS